MKRITTATVITVCLTLICSCQQSTKSSPTLEFETNRFPVNYALAEHGTAVFVSDDNYDHPASTLNNGITSSENWDAGEGWEAHFDGSYEYAKYASYGESAGDAARLAQHMREAVSHAEQSSATHVDGEESETPQRMAPPLIAIYYPHLFTRR